MGTVIRFHRAAFEGLNVRAVCRSGGTIYSDGLTRTRYIHTSTPKILLNVMHYLRACFEQPGGPLVLLFIPHSRSYSTRELRRSRADSRCLYYRI